MSARPWRSVTLIFAKAPMPGTVKTRLISKLGQELSADLHAAMVSHSVSVAAQYPNHEIQLWCAPNASHSLFRQLQKNYPVSLHVQNGDDLGQRMRYAFEQALKDFDVAIIIGTDCPGITAALLDKAYHALYADKDAVIAPAEDGGYILLGLRKVYSDLFSEIAWGTDQVYTETQHRLEQLRLSWQSLDMQWDVDRPEDLERLVNDKSRFKWHPDLQLAIKKLQMIVKNK